METSEAVRIVNKDEITFDIQDARFGDGSVVVSIAQVFDSKTEAEVFIQALKLLCKKD